MGQLHSARWGGGARVAAGVRRANGGAIFLNADATEIEALQKQVSLDSLLRDIAESTPQLAYITLDRGDFTSHTETANLNPRALRDGGRRDSGNCRRNPGRRRSGACPPARCWSSAGPITIGEGGPGCCGSACASTDWSARSAG